MSHRKRRASRALSLLAALPLLFIGIASAPAQDFYAGKTLKVVVGFPPGGGYDLYARVLAKHLPNHIAGGPTTVVVNMPGAGSLASANYLFNAAPKDGLEIGSVETFIPFEAYYGGAGVRFDPTKFSWIGALNSEMSTCSVWHASKIKSFADLLTSEASFGGTGSGAPPVVEPKVINAVLGSKIKVVTGYPGTADIFIAMERGELDGTCGVGWSSLNSIRADWVTQGKLMILAQNAVKRHPSLPDTPLLVDFAKDKSQKDLLTLLAAPHRIGRPYLAPPGVPADRLEILRGAFTATMKDPAFVAEAEKLRLGLNPVASKDIEAVFAEIAAMDRSLIQKMIDARADKR